MRTPRDNKGFTIIELMIALSILATILMMSTFIMIQIGKWYSKGVNAANLQNDSRTMISDISGALQFSGGTFRTGGPVTYADPCQPYQAYAYCVNNVRYSFVLNRELGGDQGYSPTLNTKHVLWRDTMKTVANCNPLNLTQGTPTDTDSLSPKPDGFELVGGHMRLQDMCITENSGLYTVTVNMGFGDNDLVRNSVSGAAQSQPCNGGKMTCNGGPGNEYCSASNLSTIVKKRIQ